LHDRLIESDRPFRIPFLCSRTFAKPPGVARSQSQHVPAALVGLPTILNITCQPAQWRIRRFNGKTVWIISVNNMDITWVHNKKNDIHGLEEVPHANFVQTKVHGDICKKYDGRWWFADSIMCSENMWKLVKTWKQLFSQIPSEVTFVMLTKKKS
jgi:hypothetical protein